MNYKWTILIIYFSLQFIWRPYLGINHEINPEDTAVWTTKTMIIKFIICLSSRSSTSSITSWTSSTTVSTGSSSGSLVHLSTLDPQRQILRGVQPCSVIHLPWESVEATLPASRWDSSTSSTLKRLLAAALSRCLEAIVLHDPLVLAANTKNIKYELSDFSKIQKS